MGFEGYDDENLEAVVKHWRSTPTAPGSLGEKAKRDALAEWERRQAVAGGEV